MSIFLNTRLKKFFPCKLPHAQAINFLHKSEIVSKTPKQKPPGGGIPESIFFC